MIFSTLRFLSENKGGWALPDSATLTGLPSLRRGKSVARTGAQHRLRGSGSEVKAEKG
jgi:hypothetical protein